MPKSDSLLSDDLFGYLNRAFCDAKRFSADQLDDMAIGQDDPPSRYGVFLTGALKLLAQGRRTIPADSDGEKLADLLEGDMINGGLKRGPAECVGCGSPMRKEDPPLIEARKEIIAAARRAGYDESVAEKIWTVAYGPHCGACLTLVSPFIPKP